jgi:serine/threonine-protein kinase
MPVARAAALLFPVLDALAALHAAGIVHRDVKPSNVFIEVTEQGERARLLDLGLARALNPELSTVGFLRLTAPGTALGTPRYMAPEQLQGKDDVDASADVWAFGAILFELLTGRPHIDVADYNDVVRALRTDSIASVARLAPDVPGELSTMVDLALRRDRRERPAASDFADVLHRLSAATRRSSG